MNCSAGMVFGALQNLACAIVRLPHLALLVIGQRHDAQRENLVDLRSIEEISRHSPEQSADSRRE